MVQAVKRLLEYCHLGERLPTALSRQAPLIIEGVRDVVASAGNDHLQGLARVGKTRVGELRQDDSITYVKVGRESGRPFSLATSIYLPVPRPKMLL